MTIDGPLACEEGQPPAAAQGAPPGTGAQFAPDAGTAERHPPAAEEVEPSPVSGKRLLKASADCTGEYLRNEAQSDAGVLGIRTAPTMFDHVLRSSGVVEQVRSSTSVAEPRFTPLIGGAAGLLIFGLAATIVYRAPDAGPERVPGVAGLAALTAPTDQNMSAPSRGR